MSGRVRHPGRRLYLVDEPTSTGRSVVKGTGKRRTRVHERRRAPFVPPSLAEETLQATFDQAAIGLILVDPLGRIIRANRQVTQILGYESSELVGRAIADLAD